MTGELVKTERLWSIDAFRGFTMICMLGEGFGMRHVAQFEHVSWNIAIPGDLHFWDLIQPFFMFIVGTVMPISFARRWARGETWRRSLVHVLRRSALLILLGLFARSVQAQRPVLDLINVLAQIAFTYLVAFLLLRQPWPVQGGVALGLLAIHWAIFYSYGPDPWAKDANLGWYLDRLLLHKNWSGSYATINCLSSAANTIFGMMAGELLASALAWTRKARILAATGVLGVAVGFALSPWIPLNKKIWTASFALYSTGMTLLALLVFYWIFDVIKKRRWATVFLIVGSNSIFIYVFHETLHRYMNYVAARLMNLPVPAAALLILGVEIAVCWVLYRRRVFLRV
jgi:predicted acyltransferase